MFSSGLDRDIASSYSRETGVPKNRDTKGKPFAGAAQSMT